MDPLSLLVLASAFGAKYFANQQAQNRQQSLADAMQNYQAVKARQTEQAINSFTSQETPANRTDQMNSAIADRVAQANNLVGQVAKSNPAPIAGKVSADYTASQARSADTVAERTKRAIQQLATMGAPGDVARKFGIDFGRVAGNVDANNSAISNVGNAYRTDIQGVKPDPLLNTLGDVGLALGAGMGGAPAATAGAAPADLAMVNLPAGTSAAAARIAGASPWYSRVAKGFSLWGAQ